MSYSLLKEVPRYDCLKKAAAGVPQADPSLCEVFLNVLITGDVVSRAEAAFLARHGLNQARLVVLMLLDSAETGSLRSSELADQSSVSRATITGLLDTMEKSGLILRTPDPDDRRASRISITSRGKSLLQKVRPELFQWTAQCLSGLSARERKQLVTLLHKTQSAFSDTSRNGNASHV